MECEKNPPERVVVLGFLDLWKVCVFFVSTTHEPRVSLHEPSTHELELELIQTQMTQKPMLREEVGMRVRCAKQASIE